VAYDKLGGHAALSDLTYQWGFVRPNRQRAEKARIDAEQAIALAPGLGLAHAALARSLEASALDYSRASEGSERALTLAPGNAVVLYQYSQHAAYMGHSSAAIDPGRAEPYARRGLAYYALGNNQMARSSCEMKPGHWESWLCLALVFEKLGQRRESDPQIKRLTQFAGDQVAYQYAQIYAERGGRARALDWLDTAMRLRDYGFRRLKTDPLLDPLRNEPRFQAIERELKFPQ
jgi:tetratricopeptide (TPR) repeat protein